MPPSQPGEFVRPGLALTREGLIDPEGEVIARCDELEELIEHRRAGRLDSRGLLRLLATIGWLDRVRPALRERFGRWSELSATIREVTASLQPAEVASALRCIDVPTWLERLRQIEADVSDVTRDIDTEAIVLIEALDDADLAVIVAARCSVFDETLHDDLLRCNLVVEDHADLLTGASGFVQAVAGGFRDDLSPDSGEEALLHASTAKFVAVLDACEEAERSLDADLDVRRLLQPSSRDDLVEQGEGEPEQEPTRELVGASGRLLAARGMETRNDVIEKFQSPDGAFRALLPLSGKRDPHAEVEMEFVTRDDAPASVLLGHLAVFCGARCRIGVNYSGEVVARFPVIELTRFLADERVLKVGATTWMRQRT
jgi:hypothetical protein